MNHDTTLANIKEGHISEIHIAHAATHDDHLMRLSCVWCSCSHSSDFGGIIPGPIMPYKRIEGDEGLIRAMIRIVVLCYCLCDHHARCRMCATI